MYPARRLRKTSTTSEDLLWQRLRSRRFLGLKVRRQHPVGALVLDFYCAEYKLAIEVDGGIHQRPERLVADRTRDQVLDDLGIETLRIPADDVEFRIDIVLQLIQRTIESRQITTSPSPSDGEGARG